MVIELRKETVDSSFLTGHWGSGIQTSYCKDFASLDKEKIKKANVILMVSLHGKNWDDNSRMKSAENFSSIPAPIPGL